jgi:hypothetical protein
MVVLLIKIIIIARNKNTNLLFFYQIAEIQFIKFEHEGQNNLQQG